MGTKIGRYLRLILLACGALMSCKAQTVALKDPQESTVPLKKLEVGAEQFFQYEKYLKGKRVGLVVNQTSIVGPSQTHLLDTLLGRKINIVKIFSPEHGFRGNAEAGEKVANDKDGKTGLPIISLYGSNKKPSKESLLDVDVLIFDIQDVGARFFTYISTMHYAIQACAEYGKTLIVLDRPNPNGHYVAGPVLDLKFKSFIGMHPIPIVHGLTVAELAQMINGERWLDSNRNCNLVVVPVKNYDHKTPYNLPIKPSPNLPNAQSILLYPTLCLFEGTAISSGRGTDKPFQIFGGPDAALGTFTFTPIGIAGVAKNPMHENKLCYGKDLTASREKFTLKYLIECYEKSADKEHFFIPFFSKLAGNDVLAKQIKAGESEEAITQSWAKELEVYKSKRKKYLLYKDFE